MQGKFKGKSRSGERQAAIMKGFMELVLIWYLAKSDLMFNLGIDPDLNLKLYHGNDFLFAYASKMRVCPDLRESAVFCAEDKYPAINQSQGTYPEMESVT